MGKIIKDGKLLSSTIAKDISITPNNNITSTNVQDAIIENAGKIKTLQENSSSGGGGSTVQTNTVKDAEYRILLSGSADDETKEDGINKNSGLRYNPNKGSFASGHSTKASGSNSHTEGSGTTSSGNSAHSEGCYTCATGDGSHAEGFYATATGDDNTVIKFTNIAAGNGSHAEGIATTASGKGSHAEGSRALAFGAYSHAEGYNTNASKPYAHAEGGVTIASGGYSHAEGQCTSANGDFSHAEGCFTIADGTACHSEGDHTSSSTPYAHAEGCYSIANGVCAHAEGSNTSANGDAVHVEGGYTTAYGRYCHAEGCSTYVIGEATHAEGNNTSASGYYCHAEGEGTYCTEKASHTEGSYTTASRAYAHAEGCRTYANNQASHAEGHYTTASNFASHAGGHYNAAMTTGGDYNNTTGTAFVIGNGTAYNELSNAFSVQYDGTVAAQSTITASTAADYAEFFEWEDGNPDNEDRVGKFVTIDGNKILIASNPDDYILGIVSGRPFVLGNGDCDVWTNMHLTDEYNRYIMEPAPKMELDEETHEYKEVLDSEGNPVYYGTRPKLNPDYDPSQTYISRFDRKEWAPIGMLGVLSVNQDGTCEVNGYARCNSNGIATACKRTDSGAYRVTEVLSDSIIKVILK